MARKHRNVKAEQVKELARLGLIAPEIAAVLECSVATLYRHFEKAIKEGHEHMRSSLRRKQFTLAMEGNPTMLVWLGKQYLGQRDNLELTGAQGGPIEYVDASKLSDEQLAQVETLVASATVERDSGRKSET